MDSKQTSVDDMTRKGKVVAAEVKKQMLSDGAYINKELDELLDR